LERTKLSDEARGKNETRREEKWEEGREGEGEGGYLNTHPPAHLARMEGNELVERIFQKLGAVHV
jgi:hypothetical protein